MTIDPQPIKDEHDPHFVFGPPQWFDEHTQELEKTYAESRNLRHVRVLDWLPILHAHAVPQLVVGLLTFSYRFKTDAWTSDIDVILSA